jgi:hypothetical protein
LTRYVTDGRGRFAKAHELQLSVCMMPQNANEKGAIGYILAWLIGIPIPILLIVFLVARC